MAKFKINVKTLKNEILSLHKKFNDYEDDYYNIVRNIKKVDTAWNDGNEQVFIEKVSRDASDILEHVSATKKYLNAINDFLENIKHKIQNTIYSGEINKINFDSSAINEIINHVNNIIRCANNSINSINCMIVPTEFKYKNRINELYTCFEVARANARKIGVNLESIRNSINSQLTFYYDKVSKIDFVHISKKQLVYTWQVVTPINLKSSGKLSTEKVITKNQNISDFATSKKANVMSESSVQENSMTMTGEESKADSTMTIRSENAKEYADDMSFESSHTTADKNINSINNDFNISKEESSKEQPNISLYNKSSADDFGGKEIHTDNSISIQNNNSQDVFSETNINEGDEFFDTKQASNKENVKLDSNIKVENGDSIDVTNGKSEQQISNNLNATEDIKVGIQNNSSQLQFTSASVDTTQPQFDNQNSTQDLNVTSSSVNDIKVDVDLAKPDSQLDLNNSNIDN